MVIVKGDVAIKILHQVFNDLSAFDFLWYCGVIW